MIKNHINLTTWIEEKLCENNYNIEAVKSMHEDCIAEIGKGGSRPSFERRVREVVNSMKKEGDWVETSSIVFQDAETIDYSQYDREEIVSLITDEVVKRGIKLSLKDIREVLFKNGYPESVLFKLVPDYSELVKTIHKNNMLHLNDDIKHQEIINNMKGIKRENKELKIKASVMNTLENTLRELVTIYKKPKKINFIKERKRNKEAILLLSDTHFGEIVNSEEILDLNAYNPDIAKKRVDELFNITIEYCKLFGVTTFNLHMLGDMVSGRIHEELLESNALVTIDTILQLSDYVSMWIQRISSIFKNIKVMGMPGNHGRFTKKPTYKHKNLDNYDYIMYKFMERATKNVVDVFELPVSFIHLTDHFGYKILNCHGDILKGGTGLMPVSGTWARDVAKLNGLLRQNDKGFDCMVFGHFHTGDTTFPSFDKTKIIVNGSLKGTDEFSLGAIKTGNKPSQQLLIIDEQDGLDVNKTIYLD